jgi:hypothetical protein
VPAGEANEAKWTVLSGAMEIVICFTGARLKQIGRPSSLWKAFIASVLVRINNQAGQPFDAGLLYNLRVLS